MSRHLGDSSFSQLLHTSYADLQSRQDTPSDIEEEEDIYCGSSLVFEMFDLNGTTVQPSESVVIDRRIDPESYTIFNTFADTLRQVFMPVMSGPQVPVLVCKADYDFGPLVSSLARILEVELNSSIVQYVRSLCRIEMPAYYKRYKEGCPNHTSQIIVYGQQVDINERKGKTGLKPIMTGDILLLMKRYKQEIANDIGMTEEAFGEVSKKMDKMREIRNKASHASVVTEADFKSYYTMFCQLVRQNLLTILADEKERLSGIQYK